MFLQIQHELHYYYSDAVALSPHTLYLYPRLAAHLNVKSYDLKISPAPSLQAKNLDLEGNVQQMVFFSEKCNRLNISVLVNIETQNFNPFGFVYSPFEASILPFQYPESQQKLLSPYLEKEGITTLIDQTARNLAASVDWNTTKFLTSLNEYIFTQFQYEIRELGLPNSPEITLLERRGSCRDYAVFFIACCRTLGLAARFVSGYHFLDPTQPQYLHAWAEVYLPGGGWRGFDPTQNCSATHQHVPLAASAWSEQATPVKGTFSGKAQSSFEATVSVKEIS